MVSRLATVAGAAGTVFTTLANLGCCGVALLGPAATLAGLAGVLAPPAARWGYEALYLSVAVTLVALGISGWRLGNAYPLVSAVAGSVALLLAFHEAWSVETFALLVVGGSVALVGAAITDVLLQRSVNRRRLAVKNLTCAT
jgi:hypothetical protein